MAFVLRDTAKASAAELADLEVRVGMTLPIDYKQFLAENNGGECMSGGAFRKAATGRRISGVNILLGLRDDPDYSLDTHLSYLEGRIPERILPIAYDSGGNYLLLDCSDARRGRVYFLGLEAADPGRPPSVESLTLVANTFSELRPQLESDP